MQHDYAQATCKPASTGQIKGINRLNSYSIPLNTCGLMPIRLKDSGEVVSACAAVSTSTPDTSNEVSLKLYTHMDMYVYYEGHVLT